MKARLFLPLLLVATLAGCAPAASTVAFDIAADVKKSECDRLPEPRRSTCREEIENRVKEQRDLAAEVAKKRDSRSRHGSPGDQLEKAIAEGDGN